MERYDPRLDDSDLKKMFEIIDENKDGSITLEGISTFTYLF